MHKNSYITVTNSLNNYIVAFELENNIRRPYMGCTAQYYGHRRPDNSYLS